MAEKALKNEGKTRREEYLGEDGRFKKGNPGGPGRPLGRVSIVGKAKQILRENPEMLKEIAQDLLKNEKLRTELVRQIDGAPRQKHEVGGPDGGPLEVEIVNYGSSKASKTEAKDTDI